MKLVDQELTDQIATIWIVSEENGPARPAAAGAILGRPFDAK